MLCWSNSYWERLYQVFEYSKLFFPCTQKWSKLSNGLNDFKVALYVCPIRINDGIHSHHSYLEVLEKPLCSALTVWFTRVGSSCSQVRFNTKNMIVLNKRQYHSTYIHKATLSIFFGQRSLRCVEIRSDKKIKLTFQLFLNFFLRHEKLAHQVFFLFLPLTHFKGQNYW